MTEVELAKALRLLIRQALKVGLDRETLPGVLEEVASPPLDRRTRLIDARL